MFAHIRNHSGSQNPGVGDDGRHQFEWCLLEIRVSYVDARWGLGPDFSGIATAYDESVCDLLFHELIA